MKASNIKGALLEYLVRQLFKNCGFTNVIADNIYTFQKGGLFFINGKGAAHDADIIMNPPIQTPFTYPIQLIFECKAYEGAANLPIVRNALGLRNDLNEFEIVTKKSIQKRMSNRRTTYAIETRSRYLFQVGVAVINQFTKPAIEFSANNKIPLLSLSWILGKRIILDLNRIDKNLVTSFDKERLDELYSFLKDRDGNLNDEKYLNVLNFLKEDNVFGDIITFSNTTILNSFVGLLETGDMIFLFPLSDESGKLFSTTSGISNLKAELHFKDETHNIWYLHIFNTDTPATKFIFYFYLPIKILQHWQKFEFDKTIALGIKQEYFSRVIVYSKNADVASPITIVTIDQDWLEKATKKIKEPSH